MAERVLPKHETRVRFSYPAFALRKSLLLEFKTMPTNKKVSIYTTPSCTYCRQAKEFFKEKAVNYEEYDVFTDVARRQEMVDKSGQLGVPVITVSAADGANEEVVIGYNRARLAALLGV